MNGYFLEEIQFEKDDFICLTAEGNQRCPGEV